MAGSHAGEPMLRDGRTWSNSTRAAQAGGGVSEKSLDEPWTVTRCSPRSTLDIDVDGRKARVFVQDYIETDRPTDPQRGRPGEDSRAQIVLPDGFEYEVAEIGSASSRTGGPVLVEIDDKYGQFARLHLNNDGVVRSRRARPEAAGVAASASALERLLRRDRAITAAGLAVLCALAWFYVLIGAGPGPERLGHDHADAFPAQGRRRHGRHGHARHGHAGHGDARPAAWSPRRSGR